MGKTLGSGWASTQNSKRNVKGVLILVLIIIIMKILLSSPELQNVRFNNRGNLKSEQLVGSSTHIISIIFISNIIKIHLTPKFRLGIKLEMVPEAGHHIYADQASFFNAAVNKALGDSSE